MKKGSAAYGSAPDDVYVGLLGSDEDAAGRAAGGGSYTSSGKGIAGPKKRGIMAATSLPLVGALAEATPSSSRERPPPRTLSHRLLSQTASYEVE